MNRYLYLLTAFLLFGKNIFLYGQIIENTNAMRMYSTQKWLTEVKRTSGVIENMSAIERHNSSFKSIGSIEPAIIPVVIHLLPLPTGETFSNADIQAQLDRLNADFNVPRHPYLETAYQELTTNFDELGNVLGSESDTKTYLGEWDKLEHFAEKAGNPQIRFCLAELDPKGEPTTGVLLAATTTGSWAMTDKLMLDETGSNTTWPAGQYLNIWVARLDDAAGAGWAQMPGGPAETDGIVIDDRYFVREGSGNVPNVTLSHLVGSYLNLYELWNETELCADDYVDDTPIHNAPNYNLPDVQYRHVSTCDGNPVEMISNIMDNADDQYQYLFTWGQVMRMHATLAPNGPRSDLRKGGSNCKPLGKPEETLTDRSSESDSMNPSGNLSARVHPNPTSGDFVIDIQSAEKHAALNSDVRIFNSLGDVVWIQQSIAVGAFTQLTVPADTWPKGLYSIQIRQGNEIVALKVLVD